MRLESWETPDLGHQAPECWKPFLCQVSCHEHPAATQPGPPHLGSMLTLRASPVGSVPISLRQVDDRTVSGLGLAFLIARSQYFFLDGGAMNFIEKSAIITGE